MSVHYQNPEIIKTPDGVILVYQFKIQPIDHDGSFQVGKLDLHYRTLMYEFDTDVYSFIDNRSTVIKEVPNLLDFKVSEKAIDHHMKHVTIKFGKTTFETVGNYTFNSFETRKSELHFPLIKITDPTENLF